MTSNLLLRPPLARFASGLTIHDEMLIEGRWVGRYWQGAGYAEPERLLGWVPGAAHVAQATHGLDLAAFGLELDGQSLHFGWELVAMAEEPPRLPHLRHGVVTLRSTLRPVTVELHTEVDGTGFLVRWLAITNTGASAAALGACWPLSGLLARLGVQGDWRPLLAPGVTPWRVGHMAERTHVSEGAFEWQELPCTTLRLEGRNGKSGFGQPFCIVQNQATGEHLVAALAWTGNWAIELTSEHRSPGDAWLFGRLGPVGPSPQRVIEPGETVATPAVHLGWLQTDFDGAVAAWHTHLRRTVLRPPLPEAENLVTYNHWGYVEAELTEEGLLYEVDLAAELGAELFIVDAGWFGDHGTDWWKTVGDWRCGDRLPRGLEPIFAHARAKGLRCGLWFDLERVGPDSEVVREHPDWLLPAFGRPSGAGDLDLANPEAVAHLERRLIAVIEQYQLDLFRLDYNTEQFEGGQTARAGWHENSQWRYYQNIHALYERIAARFPAMLMENCAGGGSRADLGMLRTFHYTQATDWQVPPRSIRIVNGMSIALPPERLDLKAGVGMNGHLRGDLDFTLRSCMAGHLCLIGFCPGRGEENADQLARVRHHVEVYQERLRPWLSECRIYHHTPVLPGPEPGGWAVWELVSADRSHAAVFAFRLGHPSGDTFELRPRGLDLGQRYRVTSDNRGDSFLRDGAALNDGLTLRLARPMLSELLLFEALPGREEVAS